MPPVPQRGPRHSLQPETWEVSSSHPAPTLFGSRPPVCQGHYHQSVLGSVPCFMLRPLLHNLQAAPRSPQHKCLSSLHHSHVDNCCDNYHVTICCSL